MEIIGSKKGQSIRDTFIFMAMITLLACGFLFLFYVNNQIEDKLLANSALNASNHSINAIQGVTTINSKLDYMVFVIMIGFVLAMIVAGYFIPVETIFFWIYVIGMMFGVIASIIFQYFWTRFSSHAVLAATANSFPISSHILSNLPIYYTIVAGVALIVTYAKPGRDE